MSTGRGRSWRPEKSRRVREERRRQIVLIVLALLLLLVGTAYLLLGPRVPSLHFISVLETDIGQDSNGMLVLQDPAAAVNVAELSQLLEAIHQKNPTLVAAPEPALKLSEVQSGLQLPAGEKLMLYLAAETRIVPDDTSERSPVLELLPGKQGAAPIPFRTLVEHLKTLQATQIVLLFEPSPRPRAMINGQLSDDLISVISKEVETAGLPSLAVICAYAAGERSWEYPAEQLGSASRTTTDSAADKAATPGVVYHGTVFGHFVKQAIREGRADSTNGLYQYVRTSVADWVRQKVGEQQTVLMITSGKSTADRELFARAAIPSVSDLQKNISIDTERQAGDSSADASPGPGDAAASGREAIGELTASQKFAQLTADRDRLAETGLAGAIFPVEWNRLQSSLLAAEACLQHQQTADFGRIHDQYLVPELRMLKDQTQRLMSPEGLQNLQRWLSPPEAVSEADRTLFRQTLEAVSPAQVPVPRLPTELRQDGSSRRAFVAWLLSDLTDLAEKLTSLPPEEQQKRVQQRVCFMQTLDQAGWSLEDSPHQIAALRDILHGDNTAWHITALDSAVRLVRLREQALLAASGTPGDGHPLRRSVWEQNRAAVAEVLVRLTSAERWLAAGPAGRQLAEDQLASASTLLQKVRNETLNQHRLAMIGDSQWHEVLWLIQFLASQQEQIVVSPEELESAVRMASAIVEGQDPEPHFPAGQLDSIDLRREHLAAMFAMTRDLRARPLEEPDTRRQLLLKSYVQDRGLRQTSAAERLRMLEIPLLPQRDRLWSGMFLGGTAGSSGTSGGLSGTGLWLSFWSIRLLDAVTDDTTDCAPLWRQWKEFVELLADSDESAVVKSRTILAEAIRQAWASAFRQRLQRPATGVFVTADDIIPAIAEDVRQRLDASGNSLYSEVCRQLTGRRADVALVSMQPQQAAIELDARNRTQLTLSTVGIKQLYVLSGLIKVADSGVQIERNWQRIELTETAEPLKTIVLQAGEPIREPVPLQLAGVNRDNIVVALRTVMVHPGSETEWDIELIRSDDRQMTLIRAGVQDGIVQRRLTLLPNTADLLTGMDTPTPLRVQLRRSQGTAVRASVQLYHLADNSAVWSAARSIELDPRTGTAEIALADSPAAAATSTPPAAEPKPNAIDFSEGFRLEITPEDVLQKSTSRIDIRIVFSEPEQFVERPRPVHDHTTNSLTIRLQRTQIDDPSVLLPATIPIEAYFSPQLRRFLVPGGVTAVPNLPAEGMTLRFQFTQDIVSADPSEKLEFGLSVAGIPNPWRWRLTDADPALVGDGDLQTVRVHLNVANATEVQPVSEIPELLIGENWKQAGLRADVFLYGGRFDDGQWQMQLAIRNRDLDRRFPVADAPIVLRRRYRERVRVAPGENGSWLFSTQTAAWSRNDLRLRQFGLPDGRYELLASIGKTGASDTVTEDGTPFIVDSTPPVISDDRISIPDRVPVDRVLRGTIRVEDAESGIRSVRVGLDPAMLQEVVLAGEERRPGGAFEIQPSQGFPVLEQRETDQAREVALHVEVTNRAGIPATFRRPVTFFRKGIPAKPMVENPVPGSLEVTFSSGTKYVVSISGPNGRAETKTEAMVVLFPDLPPGQYTVEWKTVGQGLNRGSAVATVTGGRKTTVVGRK